MTTLSQETFNVQFVEFWENMTFAGLDKNYDKDSMESLLKTAVAGTTEQSGLAYEGALLVHINLTTTIAKRLASMIRGTFPNLDIVSLVKVCLLQHLSKTAMFEPNDSEWQVKNGNLYKFSNLEGRLKSGERSIMYAMINNIKFSAIEYEAMVCLDRVDENKGAKVFDSPLTTVVRQANELAFMIERERELKNN